LIGLIASETSSRNAIRISRGSWSLRRLRYSRRRVFLLSFRVYVSVTHRISGPISRPKLGRVIVARGDKDVSKRVPVQIPDRRLVRCSHTRNGLILTNYPVTDGTVPCTRHEQILVNRVPLHRCDLPLVPSQRLKLFHRSNVEHLNKLIPGPRKQPIAVHVPFDFRDCILVPMQSGEILSRLGVPDLNQRVLGS